MQKIPSLEKHVVWLAAAIQLVNMIDFMMVMPLAPDIARVMTIANSDIGYIGGSYTLAIAISSLISARFLDRFDRKRVAVWAMIGLALATFGATLA